MKLVLEKLDVDVATIASGVSIGTSGTGSCTWAIDPSGSIGSNYQVSVQSLSQPTIKDASDNIFTLSL